MDIAHVGRGGGLNMEATVFLLNMLQVVSVPFSQVTLVALALPSIDLVFGCD